MNIEVLVVLVVVRKHALDRLSKCLVVGATAED